VVAGFAAVFYFLRPKDGVPQESEAMRMMTEWMKDIKAGTETTRSSMQSEIRETNKAINERLDNAGRVIAGLQKELGSMSQIGPDIRRLSETLASWRTC
jgi:hypothetical protein